MQYSTIAMTEQKKITIKPQNCNKNYPYDSPESLSMSINPIHSLDCQSYGWNDLKTLLKCLNTNTEYKKQNYNITVADTNCSVK